MCGIDAKGMIMRFRVVGLSVDDALMKAGYLKYEYVLTVLLLRIDG